MLRNGMDTLEEDESEVTQGIYEALRKKSAF